MVPLSILEASPIAAGHTAQQALSRSLQLAQRAEQLGYYRFWLAEHHNIPGMASAATTIVMAYVAGGTATIRVGAGGIMLPNHSPLVVAEQFGTLGSLFPERIDLGAGRASGTDRLTSRALRRHVFRLDGFAEDVQDLIGYLWDSAPRRGVVAIPGNQLRIPIWILGSSEASAALAAELGRPFAFASHFRSEEMMRAIETYRTRFKPSEQLSRSHLMLAFNIIAADTDDDAQFLASSMRRAIISIRKGKPEQLQAPVPDYEASLSQADKAILEEVLRYSSIGCKDRVREELRAFARLTEVDELIISSPCFDHAACLHSFELLASAWGLSEYTQRRTVSESSGLGTVRLGG